MSTIKQLQNIYPDMTADQIEELTDDEIQTLFDAADEAEADAADAAEAAKAALVPPMEGNLEPVKPEIIGDSPLLNGHRVAGDKSRSCPGMPDGTHGGIICPGEIVTFYDVGENVETWNHLVDIGAIQLDPDILNPGSTDHADD